MKTLEFDYYGGTQSVTVTTSAPDARYMVSGDGNHSWVTYISSPTSISVTVVTNTDYMARECRINVISRSGNAIDYIIVKQSGFQKLLVDLSAYVILPSSYYEKHTTYDLPFRVYGGNGNIVTNPQIETKIEKVYDGDGLYKDYIFHIDRSLNGNFVFTHSDCTDYTDYCVRNGINYNISDIEKRIAVRNIDRTVMDGYTLFKYRGREYTNQLPYIISINDQTPTVITIEYSCYFDNDLEFFECEDFLVETTAIWAQCIYDKANKKIYLKANGKNSFSDRKCMVRIVNKENKKQEFTAFLEQRSQVQ